MKTDESLKGIQGFFFVTRRGKKLTYIKSIKPNEGRSRKCGRGLAPDGRPRPPFVAKASGARRGGVAEKPSEKQEEAFFRVAFRAD